jgi:adenosylmethionine-8-amino-7-oxononanoate aminotransferase
MSTTAEANEISVARADATRNFWPHSKLPGDLTRESGIQVVTGGEGVWVVDAEGEKWFDTLSGLWLVNIGHGRREIADAVHEQMLSLSFSPHDTVSPVTARLSARLAELGGDPDMRTYFVSGGSEAVETALKLAKQYHRVNGEPGRWKVISRRGSYHGSTLACTSLGRGGGHGQSVPVDFGPLVPGNIHVSQPDEYHCHHCIDAGGCNLQCAKDIERTIDHEGAGTVAAFIGEPISAAAGIHVPHPEYWPTVREICDRTGVLMICDEVITGFGRTGKMFATEHWDVKPDIRTVAKALTSGYFPIGGVMASGKVAGAFEAAGTTFAHLITFGGNPPASAAAHANLDIMIRENMADRSAEMGTYLYESLQRLRSHSIVGDVRGGMGLLAALELVADRETRKRFPKEAQMDKLAVRMMRRHGMLGRAGDVIPLSPPLCITHSEVDDCVDRLDKVLTDMSAELGVSD